MTDICERLLDDPGVEDCKEAAAEITRLRAKIEAISQVAGKASIEGVAFAQIKARHADSDVLGKFVGDVPGYEYLSLPLKGEPNGEQQ